MKFLTVQLPPFSRHLIPLQSRIMKMTDFCNITPCNLVEVDRSFRGGYCLHQRGDNGGTAHILKHRSASTELHGAIRQKAVIFTFAAVKSWSLT